MATLFFLSPLMAKDFDNSIPLCNLVNDISLDKSSNSEYLKKIFNECALVRKKNSVLSKADSLGIDLSKMTEWQAPRFIETSWLQWAEKENIPVAKIYQKTKNFKTREKLIWKNWSEGILQLEDLLKQRSPITLYDLKNIHNRFYSLDLEIGDFAGDPGINKLVPSDAKMPLWWTEVASPDWMKYYQNSAETNLKFLDNLGLNFKNQDPDDNENETLISLNKGKNDTINIYATHPKFKEHNTKKLLRFINQVLKFAKNKKPIQISETLLSPMQAALIAQQVLVQIHPFQDGNGRVSRLIQELIMASYELPYGSSGDLMKIDGLYDFNTYYNLALEKTKEQLDHVNQCLDLISNKYVSKGIAISEIDPVSLPYRCRPVDY